MVVTLEWLDLLDMLEALAAEATPKAIAAATMFLNCIFNSIVCVMSLVGWFIVKKINNK